MAKQRFDCGIVIALREEFQGQKTFHGFEEFFELDERPQTEPFRTFTFRDAQGLSRTGVVSVMEHMSPMFAYQTTRDMLDEYHPNLIINIGIAGALSKHLRLGDVVVADEVDLYDYRGKATPSKVGPNTFSFAWGGLHFRPSQDIAERLKRIWKQSVYVDWESGCWRRLRDGISDELLNELKAKDYVRDKQRVEAGPIASGNTVSAAAAFRNELLQSRGRTLLAVEMESAGFLKACERVDCQSVVIKTISDLADENKEELDDITGDVIRAWAMSNAFDLLNIVCRSAFTFTSRSAGSTPEQRQTAGTPLSPDRDNLLDLAVSKHFKKQHRRLVLDIDKSLNTYDKLFRCFIKSESLPQGNLFEDIAQQVVTSRNPYPLRINGKPGTGKTTFLTLLYLALHKLNKEVPTSPIPVYVNLKRYTSPERGRESEWIAQAAADDDLAVLRTVLEPASTKPVVVLLDGIDEYVRYDASVENQVLDLAEQCSSAKKIVGVGLNYLGNREKFKRSLPKLDNPESKIVLEAIDLRKTEAIASAVRAFEVTYPEKIEPNSVQTVVERAKMFRLEELDLLLLSMLFDSIKSTRYAHAGTLSDFFSLYCEHVLRTDSGNETLAEAAQTAFEYAIRPGPFVIEKHAHRRCWKLLHTHASIKDFLVAWHAVDLVRGAASATDAAQLSDLNYVYPHAVNRFCKDIVNSDRDLQFDVLEGARRIFRDGGENARPHACYLAGRLSDGAAREEATEWLRTTCLPEVEKLQAKEDSKLKPSELLLCRTVYISLACLNDEGASESYVKLLLDRPEWNNINRGFHLEYYGDMPFDPERQLSHSDRLGPFQHTYENLRDRIGSNCNNSEYGLFNVEVFTLYSLAQYRHMNSSQLAQAIRVDLVEFIPQLMNSSNLSATVRDYLRMLQVNLGDEKPFTPGKLAEKLYRLKEEERGGWKERQLPLKRIESVADHTAGAFILGLAYLPEVTPKNWPDYDKNMVLLYVMIHDLAESISGDVTLQNSNEDTRAKEREAFQYLMMCKTYPRIANLEVYYRMWEEFESKANENARIAKDLDKLENLMQLYLYRRQTAIPDFAQWRRQLINAVATSAGKQVLRILQEQFEPETSGVTA